MSNPKKEKIKTLTMGCYVDKIIENGGVFERVYKCPDGKVHYIPESLLFSPEAAS